MNKTQCNDCGEFFDLDEEGTVGEVPDGTDFAMCGECLNRAEELAEWFYS